MFSKFSDKTPQKKSPGILVVFPGRNYSTDAPLLYYGKKIYARNGYEVLALSYEEPAAKTELSIPERILFAKKKVFEKLENISWEAYTDIVFLSKSMGSVIAGEAAEKLAIPARQIYLTPLKGTLPFMTHENSCMVFAGTKDSHLSEKELALHCKKYKIPCRQYKGTGHSLEVPEDNKRTLQILLDILQYYEADAR